MDTRDALVAELWECGTIGIIENPDTVQAFFDTDADISHIASQLPYPVLQVQHEIDLITPSTLPQNRDPIYVGQRFFIVSSWMNHPTPPDRRRLVIDANDAFGSGNHESTQLVIQALEKYLQSGATVFDVGCGSGILAAVALELGAGQVFACDTHIGSLVSARQQSGNSRLFAGSIDAVAHSVADVVIVNISARIIDLLAGELLRVTKPRGLVILAGFTNGRTPVEIYPEDILQLNSWVCWICRPEGIKVGRHRSHTTLQPFPEQWW
jgi:ribosomal protein L11 methylase PrmA